MKQSQSSAPVLHKTLNFVTSHCWVLQRTEKKCINNYVWLRTYRAIAFAPDGYTCCDVSFSLPSLLLSSVLSWQRYSLVQSLLGNRYSFLTWVIFLKKQLNLDTFSFPSSLTASKGTIDIEIFTFTQNKLRPWKLKPKTRNFLIRIRPECSWTWFIGLTLPTIPWKISKTSTKAKESDSTCRDFLRSTIRRTPNTIRVVSNLPRVSTVTPYDFRVWVSFCCGWHTWPHTTSLDIVQPSRNHPRRENTDRTHLPNLRLYDY